jgi:hypothetical protein
MLSQLAAYLSSTSLESRFALSLCILWSMSAAVAIYFQSKLESLSDKVAQSKTNLAAISGMLTALQKRTHDLEQAFIKKENAEYMLRMQQQTQVHQIPPQSILRPHDSKHDSKPHITPQRDPRLNADRFLEALCVSNTEAQAEPPSNTEPQTNTEPLSNVHKLHPLADAIQPLSNALSKTLSEAKPITTVTDTFHTKTTDEFGQTEVAQRKTKPSNIPNALVQPIKPKALSLEKRIPHLTPTTSKSKVTKLTKLTKLTKSIKPTTKTLPKSKAK